MIKNIILKEEFYMKRIFILIFLLSQFIFSVGSIEMEVGHKYKKWAAYY